MKKLTFAAILLGAFIIIIDCGGDDIVNRIEPVSVYLYPDSGVSVFYDDSLQLRYDVFSTPNTAVDWYIDGIAGGNDSLGTISATGMYHAPSIAIAFDEVQVKVVSQADTTKSDSLEIIIRDRYYIYVQTDGDDVNGRGTSLNPYRTIARGIDKAIQGQIIRVGEGTFGEGETYPLVPRVDITIEGRGIDSTFVQAPYDTSTFRIEYENAHVRALTIIGVDKQGSGLEFAGGYPIDSLQINNLKVENCNVGVVNNADSVNIETSNLAISNCTYGLVIRQPGVSYIFSINNSSFTGIDSIAVRMISPMRTDMDAVTIDVAFIGVETVGAGFCFIQNSTFSNIDSVAVLLNNIADLQSGGGNDFSGCADAVWCLVNMSPETIAAEGNTWPASDSATIDSRYIYDDDEDNALGPVDFIPFN